MNQMDTKSMAAVNPNPHRNKVLTRGPDGKFAKRILGFSAKNLAGSLQGSPEKKQKVYSNVVPVILAPLKEICPKQEVKECTSGQTISDEEYEIFAYPLNNPIIEL